MSARKDLGSGQVGSRGRKRKATSTGRGKQGDNASDEKSTSAKQQKIQTTKKRSGVAHDGGQQFEIKIAAVIGLRGMARGDDFELSTNTSDSDTGQRRQGGNASDEQSPPAKRQQKFRTLPKRSGVAHDGGQQFEIKMAAVIGLRGTARGDDFQLSTNKAGSGNFDDLLYTTRKRRYYLQLKHTDNPDYTKLVHSDLVPLLHQCFESFFSIIQDPTFNELESSEFIIYTNKQLGPKLFQHNRQHRVIDEIFKTCDTGEIFNFTPDQNKEIDVYSLVENKVTESKEYSKLSLQDRDFKLKMIGKFLKKLIMVTGQKEQKEIDNVIIEEIRKLDAVTVEPKEYQTELLHFKMPLESWWRTKHETMIPETLRKWLQEAKTKTCASVVGSMFEICKQKIFGTEMKFSDTEVSRLHAELSKKHGVYLRSDALTLCRTLLLECLDTSKYIFVTLESLQSNKNLLLHAWLGGHWEWLIVFCDSAVQNSDISETCLEISEIIKHGPSSKRVVILTACKVQQVGDFVPIEHEFKFEQLSKESQEIVLDKTIDFQGCEVTMRSVLQRHGNVEHVLGPELVTDLVNEGSAVNIGGRLQVNEGYYAPRVLEKNIFLQSNVLQNSNDVFAVSGTTKKELFKIVPSGKSVERVWEEGINSSDFTQDMRGRIFLLSDKSAKNSFLAICKEIQGTNLHWVEFKNGDFLWKISRGSIETLLDYIDAAKTRADKRTIREFMRNGNCEVNENSIRELGERTVLVVAEPGMGKSSTTTQVAWHTKLADPTSWVLRINWNDHTRKLHEINAATFNFDSLVEFLCSTAFPESKYTDTNSSLLKHALQYSGNVTVLMDGFDEISPTHEDKADVILSELMKTEVRRVWVTSRPVKKKSLERKLSVFSFGLKRLSRASQKEMLRKLWKYKADEKEKELNFFLWSVNESVNDENFSGCPLYITMIATVYERDVDKFSNPYDSQWRKIDLVNMYEVFVDKKLLLYLTEKMKADISNSCVLDDHEEKKERYLTDFEICALVAIVPPSMLKSLHNKKIEEKIQPFLDRVQAGKDKTGIVMNVMDGKPQFVHRTFAEFFTARWFSRNFKDNRSVLEDILFDSSYLFMTDLFYAMLVKDCPLHCAALQRNYETVNTLLEEGCDLNAVDKGGRTFMHVLATRHSTWWFKMNRNSNYEASLNNTDSVLQWTPLQYAVKSKNWTTVERLLESNVDRSGLDMIRPRAQDPDYIDGIISLCVLNGHLLLLEFLSSIGVNIYAASSRIFPSPLHAAIQVQQLKVVRLLIQHGADCNTRYSDLQTPLFYAVTKSLLDIVRLLVEEGGASMDIRDDKGRTIIDWAEEYASLPACQRPFPWEYRVDRSKEIVKYLQEKMCDVSSSVRQKVDPTPSVLLYTNHQPSYYYTPHRQSSLRGSYQTVF